MYFWRTTTIETRCIRSVTFTLTCLRASSGGRLATLPICVSTQALTAALESRYCCQSLTACWYLVHKEPSSLRVSSQAWTASLTTASTRSLTSAAQDSRNGSAADFSSLISTSRATNSPFRPCGTKKIFALIYRLFQLIYYCVFLFVRDNIFKELACHTHDFHSLCNCDSLQDTFLNHLYKYM